MSSPKATTGASTPGAPFRCSAQHVGSPVSPGRGDPSLTPGPLPIPPLPSFVVPPWGGISTPSTWGKICYPGNPGPNSDSGEETAPLLSSPLRRQPARPRSFIEAPPLLPDPGCVGARGGGSHRARKRRSEESGSVLDANHSISCLADLGRGRLTDACIPGLGPRFGPAKEWESASAGEKAMGDRALRLQRVLRPPPDRLRGESALGRLLGTAKCVPYQRFSAGPTTGASPSSSPSARESVCGPGAGLRDSAASSGGTAPPPRQHFT
jgi:hypothetical protein